MSTLLDHCPEPMTATARPAFPARVIQATAGLLRAWRNRREIHRLGEMSEYELADIGLTRADLHVAFRTPLRRDPTAELGVIAEARAFARQEAARRIC
jgi:uncharacterized protein YjiS (DUF1127 family)